MFGTAMAWFVSSSLLASSSARGLTNRFNADSIRPLIASLFLIFLLAVGFSLLEMISRRSPSLRVLLGLPRRPSAGREWLIGVAVGWGAALLAVLPLVLTRGLHISFWLRPRAFMLVLINIPAIAAFTLAEEMAFRGYPFRHLIRSIGPVVATVVMSLLYGLTHVLGNGTAFRFWPSLLISALMGVLFSLAWLRTHGLWLPWGLHFAWNVSLGVLFGLPVSGSIDGATVVQTNAYGSASLTGGDFGPEAATFTIIAVLAAIVVLVRVTRDYAWHYTFEPPVAGGYPMEAKPPAAHTAMQQSAPPPPALVQILPTTPQARSVTDDPEP